MSFIKSSTETIIKLQLSRDLVRSIKRGHAWVYSNALRNLPKAQPGSQAVLLDNRGGKEIARGFFDPESAIALRICTTEPSEKLNDDWAEGRMHRALALRKGLFDNKTTGYRLFNGEGDGLPGLVCDIYDKNAAIKLDRHASDQFWDLRGISEWLNDHLDVHTVYKRQLSRRDKQGEVVFGNLPEGPVPFYENGVKFTADLIKGQKTGFYLDQRDNRERIRKFSKGRSILNMFGYTGGLSVYAGLGEAIHVTTVDSAKPALDVAEDHWTLNQLDPSLHSIIQADAFEFLESSIKQGNSWDMVILDPPSFAPSESAVPGAIAAYEKLISAGAKLISSGGLLAAASCSSHVTQAAFLDACENGISKAKRKSTIISINGLPSDHPTPLVMPELRYLKFVLMQLD